MYVISTIVGEAEPSEPFKVKVRNTKQEATRLSVYSTSFQSCFASVFPHSVPHLGVIMNILCQCVLELC